MFVFYQIFFLSHYPQQDSKKHKTQGKSKNSKTSKRKKLFYYVLFN